MGLTERIDAIYGLVQQDVGRRGLAGEIFAATRADIHGAWELAFPTGTVGIVTGFFIPGADRPETDGPPGAVFLARCLLACGVPAALISDPFCRPALVAGLTECGLTGRVRVYDLPHVPPLTHLVAVERVGPAADGRCYTMRGLDITDRMAPVEHLFTGRMTVGIGDGGNEIGMGLLPREMIARNVPRGEQIACRVATDFLITAGISNWGAWALGVAILILCELPVALDLDLERRILQRMIDEGGLIDGVSGEPTLSVDGLPWDEYVRPLAAMKEMLR